jgi:hypothetical protein
MAVIQNQLFFYAPSMMSHLILCGFRLFKCFFGHNVLSLHIIYTLLTAAYVKVN